MRTYYAAIQVLNISRFHLSFGCNTVSVNFARFVNMINDGF